MSRPCRLRARPLLAIALVLVATALLAACGGSEPLPAPAEAPPTTETVPQPEPPPAETVPEAADVTAFVTAFMEARLAGQPAESFLTATALDAYTAHTTGLYLYDEGIAGGDSAKVYESFTVSEPLPGDAAWTVEVRVPFTWLGDSPPGEFLETLTIGPGTAAAGDEAPLLVTGAVRETQTGEGLPAAVATTREAIIAAAHARDYAALGALLDPATFSYSFGERGDPIGFWRELEEVGEVPVLGDILPGILSTHFSRQEDIYVWPSAAAKEALQWTPEDIASMEAFYTAEDIASFREIGGYLGWRVGIRADGTWLFFVSGD